MRMIIKKQPPKILQRGDKVYVIKAVFHISAKDGDMQFVPMQIVWKDTFQVTKKEKLDSESADFELSHKK